MHGKLSKVHHTAKGVFAGIPQDFSATRYHSLVIERETLPEFHPESIASEHGHQLLANFLDLARVERRARGLPQREAAGAL
jgi:anthranilate synthase component 2